MTLALRGTLEASQAVQTSSSRSYGCASSRTGASSTDAPATPASHGPTPSTGVTRFSAMVAGIVATRGHSESPAGQCGEFGSMTSRRLESALRWRGYEEVLQFDVATSRRRTSHSRTPAHHPAAIAALLSRRPCGPRIHGSALRGWVCRSDPEASGPHQGP